MERRHRERGGGGDERDHGQVADGARQKADRGQTGQASVSVSLGQ
jgi:hypothetical protein